jgi:hypothetical protein
MMTKGHTNPRDECRSFALPLVLNATAIYRPSMSPTRDRRERDRDELLSTHDAGKILNITPDGVRYLERRGKLRATYLRSGQRLFRLEDVERLARARGGEIEPPADTA